MTRYNGWANYETWNVALWLQNDEKLYEMAIRNSKYEILSSKIEGSGTPDGIRWDDPRVDVKEIDLMLSEEMSREWISDDVG